MTQSLSSCCNAPINEEYCYCTKCGKSCLITPSVPAHDELRNWKEEFSRKHAELWTVGSIGVESRFGKFGLAQDIDRNFAIDFIASVLHSQNEEMHDNIMGALVKNSTGFDTIGSPRKRMWHVDIDAFEAEILAIIRSNQGK